MRHNFTQDFFEPVGEWYGTKTCLQHHRCRLCGKKTIAPHGIEPVEDGCTGLVMKKIVRPNPFEGRDDDREEEKRTKHYQQAEKGKKQKKNQRLPVQW